MVKLTAEYLGHCMRAQGRAADAREAALRAVNADLLAACEAALEDGQDYKLSETIKRRLRAAIDKAKAD